MHDSRQLYLKPGWQIGHEVYMIISVLRVIIVKGEPEPSIKVVWNLVLSANVLQCDQLVLQFGGFCVQSREHRGKPPDREREPYHADDKKAYAKYSKSIQI